MNVNMHECCPFDSKPFGSTISDYQKHQKDQFQQYADIKNIILDKRYFYRLLECKVFWLEQEKKWRNIWNVS